MDRVDFHIHYDPLYENTAFVAIDRAQEKNVVAMALLARDEYSSNFSDFQDYGLKRGIDVISGIETLGSIDGQRVDLICLNFNVRTESVRKYFGQEEQRQANARMASLQKQYLASEGYFFEDLGDSDQMLIDQILAGKTVEKAIRFCEIASSNLANRFRIDSEKLNHSEMWQKVIGQYSTYPNYSGSQRKLEGKFLYLVHFDVNQPGFNYVRERTSALQISVVNIFDSIHQAKGVVLYSPEGNFKRDMWSKLRDLGIDGIMGWHADRLGYDKGETDIPIGVIIECVKNGKLVLGGSDYQQKDWELGSGNGNMYISPRRYRDLVNYIKARY